jgi:hypothetical protein
MIWFVLAGLLLATATVIDCFVKLRMTRIGYKKAFLMGGAFDYSTYDRVRSEYGWSAWPVRVFWISVTLGILFLGFAFAHRYGLNP